ncbi:MAG: CYTH domain-containing protein [Pseudomonadales bacterium]
MAQEIERKFLLSDASWRPNAAGERYIQAYLCESENLVARVRLTENGALLTLKSNIAGMRRSEFEYAIPYEDGQQLVELCMGSAIIKTRYKLPFAGKTWEIDVFDGDNSGLVIVEIELADETETIATPDWLGKEVTDDPKFYNKNLSLYPYASWTEEEKSA